MRLLEHILVGADPRRNIGHHLHFLHHHEQPGVHDLCDFPLALDPLVDLVQFAVEGLRPQFHERGFLSDPRHRAFKLRRVAGPPPETSKHRPPADTHNGLQNAERLQQSSGHRDPHHRAGDIRTQAHHRLVDAVHRDNIPAGHAHEVILQRAERVGTLVLADRLRHSRIAQDAIGVDQPLVPHKIMDHLGGMAGKHFEIQAHRTAFDLLDAGLGVPSPGRRAGDCTAKHLQRGLCCFLFVRDHRLIGIVFDRVVASAHLYAGAVIGDRLERLGLDLIFGQASNPLLLGLYLRPERVHELPGLVDEFELGRRHLCGDFFDGRRGDAVAILHPLPVLRVAGIEHHGNAPRTGHRRLQCAHQALAPLQPPRHVDQGLNQFPEVFSSRSETYLLIGCPIVHCTDECLPEDAIVVESVHLAQDACEFAVRGEEAIHPLVGRAPALGRDDLGLPAVRLDRRDHLIDQRIKLALVFQGQQLVLELAQVLDVLDRIHQPTQFLDRHIFV